MEKWGHRQLRGRLGGPSPEPSGRQEGGATRAGEDGVRVSLQPSERRRSTARSRGHQQGQCHQALGGSSGAT